MRLRHLQNRAPTHLPTPRIRRDFPCNLDDFLHALAVGELNLLHDCQAGGIG